MDAGLMLLISALTPWLLERLKTAAWFPFMSHVGKYAPILNRLTPMVVAAVMAAGITFQFDDAAGVLTIKGLVPSDIVRGLLLWAAGAGTQHLAYHRAIKAPEA